MSASDVYDAIPMTAVAAVAVIVAIIAMIVLVVRWRRDRKVTRHITRKRLPRQGPHVFDVDLDTGSVVERPVEGWDGRRWDSLPVPPAKPSPLTPGQAAAQDTRPPPYQPDPRLMGHMEHGQHRPDEEPR